MQTHRRNDSDDSNAGTLGAENVYVYVYFLFFSEMDLFLTSIFLGMTFFFTV